MCKLCRFAPGRRQSMQLRLRMVLYQIEVGWGNGPEDKRLVGVILVEERERYVECSLGLASSRVG